MKLDELDIGLSPLTGFVYLGKTDPKDSGQWKGKKRDISNRFLDVVLQKFEPNTITPLNQVSEEGEKKYRVVVVDASRKIEIDGEEV